MIDPDGRVFFFWTAWDAERQAPTFRIWREQPPRERWLRGAEYRRARRAVGLEA